MKVRAIPTSFITAAPRLGRWLAMLAIVLALLSPAAAQQYPPPAYPAQPPAYPGPGQPPAYPGPGYGGPTTAPPPLQQEAIPPPPPGPAMVWTPGYWNWGRDGWVWVPGRYVARPYRHAVWVPGHWRPRGPT